MWTSFDRYYFDPLALLGHVLLAAIVGGCAILFPLFCVPVVLGTWLLALAWWIWRWQPPERPWLGAAAQCVVVASIFTAGVLAPVKIVDRLLDEGRVRLPQTRLTLAELAEPFTVELASPFARPLDWRPLRPQMSADEVVGERGQQVIEFPATTMSLRQFVQLIEAQTSLRHRFSHCGNGTTVLHGGDCSFGLHFRTRNSHVP